MAAVVPKDEVNVLRRHHTLGLFDGYNSEADFGVPFAGVGMELGWSWDGVGMEFGRCSVKFIAPNQNHQPGAMNRVSTAVYSRLQQDKLLPNPH
jgi:hypothetical protein